MRKKLLTLNVLCVLAAGFGLSATSQAAAPSSCEQIKAACESAGFVKGDYKGGNGLWADCVGPIMMGGTQPKKASKPLPTVDAQTVSDCKAKDPTFGERKSKTMPTTSTASQPAQ